MKKKIFAALSVILAAILLWGCLLMIDIVRVGSGYDASVRPLITVSTQKEEAQLTYTSLGYTLTYELRAPEELDSPWGFSFLLFGDHFIWGGIS
ncbi:MAG: hypothetical protein ACI3VN_07630 [Candidatus Onthomonas sp.]